MLNAKVKAYVADMGIGDDFYQKMMSTDSSTMAILDRKVSLALIPKYDPKFDQERISREARRYGILLRKCGSASMRRKAAKDWGTRRGSRVASAPNSGP